MLLFSDDIWLNVVDQVSIVLDLGLLEKAKIKDSNLAKLIAAIPYLANCKNPARSSFSGLVLFTLSKREVARDIFRHTELDDDNIYSRLEPLYNLLDGDGSVIQRYKNLLALCMVSNYEKDAENDLNLGKYNPIANKKWDADEIKNDLKTKIKSFHCSEMDKIFTINDALKGFWE